MVKRSTKPSADDTGLYACNTCDYKGDAIFFNSGTGAQHCGDCMADIEPLLLTSPDFTNIITLPKK